MDNKKVRDSKEPDVVRAVTTYQFVYICVVCKVQCWLIPEKAKLKTYLHKIVVFWFLFCFKVADF